MKEPSVTQAVATEVLRVTRPRVSDVVNHKVEKFTIDALVSMLTRIVKHVHWRCTETQKTMLPREAIPVLPRHCAKRSMSPIMLMTISTTRHPATELGYLLDKSPARLHTFRLTALQIVAVSGRSAQIAPQPSPEIPGLMPRVHAYSSPNR